MVGTAQVLAVWERHCDLATSLEAFSHRLGWSSSSSGLGAETEMLQEHFSCYFGALVYHVTS